MMRRITTLAILLIIFIFNGYAQSLSDVIKKMPENIIWGITNEQKEEILANPSDSTATITGNSLYNNYLRKAVTDNYLKIQTSATGHVQIKLLPLINNTNIICVIKTVCKEFCDSNISFYTTDWKAIEDSSLFPKPDINWFLKSNIDKQSDEYKNAIAAIDILPIKLDISPNSNAIQVELDIEKYLDQNSYKKVQIYLEDNDIVFNWDKTRFK